MTWRYSTCVALVAALAFPVAIRAQKDQGNRILNSIEVFEEVMKGPDSAIPKSFLKKAEAINR